ncbi:MAG TPA: hypothetical protein VG755_20540 [Nannocystaceae bacterium]|nr:hypothetical protein [Nannocystaceae bacterium]
MASRRLSLVLPLIGCSCYAPHAPITSDGNEPETTGGSSSTDASTGSAATATTTMKPTSTASSAEESGGTEMESTGGGVCGNGRVEDGEACDDGENDGSYGGCSSDCTVLGPHCGDGLVNGDEGCDDGVENLDGHGCNHDCVVSGSMLWALQYDGADGATDRAYGVDVDSADNVIVAGQENAGSSNARGWIRVYDPNGNTSWSQVNEGEAGSFAYNDVAVDPSDDIAAAGAGYAAGQGQGLMAQVRKYDAFDGATLWTDTLSSELLDQSASGVASDDEGYFAEIGWVWPDILVRRLAPDGHEVWRRTISGTAGGASVGRKVAIDGSKNIICVGRILQPEGPRIWVRKYDSNGAIAWTRILDDLGSATPNANDVAVDSDGNAIIVASLGVAGEMLLRKLDADGNDLWSDDILDVGIEMDYVVGVATDAADNIVIAGTGGTDSSDIAALKFDADGGLLWAQLLTNNGMSNNGNAIATDSADNVVVVGSVLDSSTDIWVAKLAP